MPPKTKLPPAFVLLTAHRETQSALETTFFSRYAEMNARQIAQARLGDHLGDVTHSGALSHDGVD